MLLHNSPKKDHPPDVSTCNQGQLGSPLKQVYSEHQEDWEHSPMTVVVGRPERSVLGQLLHRMVHSHWVLPGCYLVGTQRKEGPYWVKARERDDDSSSDASYVWRDQLTGQQLLLTSLMLTLLDTMLDRFTDKANIHHCCGF